MSLDNFTNFGLSTLAGGGIDASQTTASVPTNDGSLFASSNFNAYIWNDTDCPSNPGGDPDVEVVRCSSRAGDVFTISRGEEGTSGVAHNTGGKTYRIWAPLTAKTLTTLSNLHETKTNVKDYDAVGDDIEDDTAAIKAAADALDAAGGGRLFFPRGRYKTTAAGVNFATYTNQISIEGEGSAASVIHVTGTLGFNLKRNTEYDGLEIESIGFEGDYSTGQTLLEIQKQRVVYIQDCHFSNAQKCINFQSTNSHAVLQSCSFTWGATALASVRAITALEAKQVVLNDCTFKSANATAVLLYIENGSNQIEDLIFSGNTVVGTHAYTIQVEDGADLKSVVVHGNTVSDVTTLFKHESGTIDTMVIQGNAAVGDGTGTAVIIKSTVNNLDPSGNAFSNFDEDYDIPSAALRHDIGQIQVLQKSVEITLDSGTTTETESAFIPPACIVLGITFRVTTSITGPTSYDIGDDDDGDLYVDGSTDLTAGDQLNSHALGNATAPKVYSATQDLELTAIGGNWTTGAIRVTMNYIKLMEPVS